MYLLESAIDKPDISINLFYRMFYFVECICRGEAEFEYEPVYLVDHKSDWDALLESMSNNGLCVDHHLQKVNIATPVCLEDTNPLHYINHKHNAID
jgi:hypothetical protein